MTQKKISPAAGKNWISYGFHYREFFAIHIGSATLLLDKGKISRNQFQPQTLKFPGNFREICYHR